MPNPLIHVGFEIPFDQIEAAHVEPAIDELLTKARSAVDEIVTNDAPRSYANTLLAVEQATEMLERASTVVGHLESVASSEELRTAYNATHPKVSAFWSELAMNDGLYQAIVAFAQTEEAAALPATEKRFLKKTLDDFRRHGAELGPEDKAKLREIEIELTKLTTKFSQNVLDETNAFELLISDESKLAGLPESAKQAAAQNARSKGLGGWRFTLHAPSMIPVLTYLDDASIREQVWRAYNTRAVSGERDNREVIARVLELRRAKAELLGYADFSDLVTEDRMAKAGAKAKAFIDDLRQRTEEAFRRENRALEAFRKELEGGATRALEPWDIAYYSEKQRQAKYDFNEEELRPYFPLDRVLDGLFATAQALYEIEIVEREAKVWDPDVKSFAIHDRDGTMIAAFYVDLFPRENKRGGAWMNSLISAAYREGQPVAQLGLFCANVNPPVGEKPALLTHREVETLFHEFGHLLHHCLSRVSVRSLAGTNVAWDFVELPSQIMENWCWERSGLDLFAAHYETGERIPDALYEKMIRARTYRAANAQMRQLGFSAVDLALHRDYEPTRDGEVMAYARAIIEAHSATTLPDDYAMLAGFGHVFAHPTGYASGYYSYKWAEVLDADAFTRFKREGITNPEVGRAFREAILSKGNSEEAEKLYEDFMGRGPELDPLLERTGLA
ncbi:MAG: M3 family metallopeptidase [Deltaproteobacteria bacterium]|nr:M3 family metallopeptidase [Deltaproteobacteria bacterium]MBT8466937.1 M3 family metallopeptidase [Deltaproteobacteria bacterium]NNK41992.1 M3 family metallopeptidase [Myxococcales bacterium]RZV53241.1 MAG: M3 family peptidase [Deltaproteobacteria bacterium]